MYKSFYNLTRNPFEMSPDPAFLFSTKSHKEALATLHYGVRRRKGFTVMTGEVGTGKTLLLRCLMLLLKSENIPFAYVFNARLSPLEFLQYVAEDFRIPGKSKNKSDLLLGLCEYVISRFQRNLTTVLIVDEAHDLSANLLEEIRLLTNLETTNEKLLQIVLVGQPELDEKLDSFNLRQLKQRITLRSQLQPLTFEETQAYVERRLVLAGADSNARTLFPSETTASIYDYTQGIPRLINTICENSLIIAYSQQVRTVTIDIVDEVARGLRLTALNSQGLRSDADPAGIAATAMPTTLPPSNEQCEIQHAVKTMLEVHERLKTQQFRAKELYIERTNKIQ